MKKKFIVFLSTIFLLTVFSVTSLAYTIGDVNRDGDITASDARLALRYSAQLEEFDDEQFEIADVDKSGGVTASDVRKMLRVAAGLDGFSDEFNISEYLVEDGVLNVAVVGHNQPFSYIENGEFKGINIDLMKKAADQYDLELRFHEKPEYQMQECIESRECDIAIYADVVVFGGNFACADVYYENCQNAVLADGKYIASTDELKSDGSMKIGVIENSIADKMVSRDAENGGFGNENIIRYKSCIEGADALKQGEIYAFITDQNSANYMSDEAGDGVVMSQRYSYDNYMFFGLLENKELVKRIEDVITPDAVQTTVDSFCYYECVNKILVQSNTITVAPGGTATFELYVDSFYGPVRVYSYLDTGYPYKISIEKPEGVELTSKYYISVSIPANVQSGSFTIGTDETCEDISIKINVNVDQNADKNYYINGITDIPDFGVMTKTEADMIIVNGESELLYTYSAETLNENGITIEQARKYMNKLTENGFKWAYGHNAGDKIYKNERTGESVQYREDYDSRGNLEKIEIDCVFLKYLENSGW